ncbi:hypothetical protein HPP92_003312 [Vanilla planifolia]|uniref:X8 domain-containing protein n=1 Tax=Vanilla planifolia TaxID=51239 RepID=A0A835S2S4_VANPL|nr:hypothetical protein HPP92_003312 [Vanilla planifolia]
MWPDHRESITFLLFTVALLARLRAAAVGVNWGFSSSHPLPPATVVSGLLRANNISKVKLFDAQPAVLESLAGSGTSVVVGIPNEMIAVLNSSKKAAATWVHDNITRYFHNGGVGNGFHIEYIAIGDEPFLLSYGVQFEPFVVGAAINIHNALVDANLVDRIKIIIPCSSDVYQSNSSLPSTGHFRPDLNRTMFQLLTFLNNVRSPFVLDINPFSSLQQNKNFSMDHLLFRSAAHPLTDGHNKYKNFFDVSIDTLVASLTKAGFGYMDIIVGKVGWPTNGAINASSEAARCFLQGLIEHLDSKIGTPLRPKRPPLETYIFSLLDEDRRSISTGNYERHFGIFTFDGQAKYNVDLGQGSKKLSNAEDVEYLSSRWCVVNNNKELSNASTSALNACAAADCSALSPGGSCNGIGWPGNISYAFNSYYQLHDQSPDSCDFGGLGLITTVNPSVGDCLFAVTLHASFSSSLQGLQTLLWRTSLSAFVSVHLLHLSV